VVAAILAVGFAGAWPTSSAAQSWDVAPLDPDGATVPEACPGGDGQVNPADALVALRRAVGLVSGFRCFGAVVSDAIIDVAPASVDSDSAPPTFVAMGNGKVEPADALLLLRAAVGLIQLVPAGGPVDLFFSEGGAPSSPVEASDADRIPLGNFPGVEDLDDGDGEIDERQVALLPRLAATQATPATRLCAFSQDPSGGAIPLACTDVAPFAAGEARRVSLAIPAPKETGNVPIWMRLDEEDVVAEVDESNNIRQVTLTLVAPLPALPDLVFDALRPLEVDPPAPVSDSAVTIRARVRNQGEIVVPSPFAVDLFLNPLSPPPMLGDCGLFGEANAGLGVDEEQIVVFSDVSLGSVEPGLHALWGLADSGLAACPGPDDIEESREDNNATPVPLELCVASPASDAEGEIDLQADALNVEVEGSSFAVVGFFSNAGGRDLLPFIGSVPAEPAAVRITVEPAGATPLEVEREVRCLIHASQQSLTGGQLFDVPAALPATVRLRLDPEGRVGEGDETNNGLCVRVFPDGSQEPCP